MTTMVASAAAGSPRALARGHKRRRAPKHAPLAPAPAPTTTTSPAPAAAPATAATPAPPAPGSASTGAAPAAPAAAPGTPAASPEYDPVDLADVTGGIIGDSVSGAVAPIISSQVGSIFDPADHPYFASPYGKVIPAKLTGAVVGELGNAVSSIVSDALKGVLNGHVPGVGEPAPGLGYTPTPANKLIARTVKGVSTTWAKLAVSQLLAPPPPPPAPKYPADVKPLPAGPVPAPPPPTMVLGQPIKPILRDAAMGVVGMGISALYDQTVGPLVQRAANVVTGRADEPIKPAPPLTIGKVANGFVDSVLSSLLIRNVGLPDIIPGSKPPVAMPGSAGIAASIMNGVLGAAWSTVYGRGLGTAIENGVNQLAGVRDKAEIEKSPLPALEHFTRAATRGVAVGATTYVVGNALMNTMVQLGARIGGVGGLLVAAGGAALIGAVGGSVVDATIGPFLGKLGGNIYSWITGNPSYEQRMAAAAKKQSPAPGSPVNAPNGNPGTVPSSPAAPAPAPAAAPATAAAAPAPVAAPHAGAPKRRKRTGNRAVDATAPAIAIKPGTLARIAVANA